MKSPFRISHSSRRALLLTAAALPLPLWADLTWNPSGTTNNWSTDVGNTNWLPGNVVWTQNENAIFNGTAETVTATTANTFNDITFDLGGFILAAGSGSFNLANDQASTITVTNAADLATITETIADNSAGISSLTKAGAGTLLLSGANTYTGQTLVTAGTLKAGAAGALGGSGAGAETLVSSGATFDINDQALTNTEIFRIAGVGVGGNGALVNTGAAGQQNALNRVVLTADATVGGSQRFDIRPGTTPTLDLAGFTLTKTGANQFSLVGTTVTSGSLTVNAGTLSIETTSTVQGTGTITVNSGAILGLYGNTAANVTRPITLNNGTITNLGSGGGINSNITLSGGGTISAGTGNLTTTFGGNITGSGPLAVTGTGAVALNGTNSYTGGTTITDARLQIGANIAGVGDGTITVNGDGTVSDGQLYMSGAATLPATKNFIISGRGGNTVDTAQRGAIRLDNGATIDGTIQLSGNAAIGSNAGVGTLNGVISGNFELTKVDTGTIVLTGNNTYTGGTNVAAGTLRLDYTTSDSSKLDNAGVLRLSGGTLDLLGFGDGSTTHTEIVASTTLSANTTSTITRAAGAGNRIALGAITPGQFSFLNVSANSIATTTNVPVAGNLGSWLTVGGTSLATTNGSNEIVAVTYTDIPTGAGIITDGMDQVRITGAAGNVTLDGVAGDVIDANSLTRSEGGVAGIDTTGKTLRLGAPGVVFSSTGSGGMSIGITNDGGNLTAGGADNTAGLLDFNLVAGDVVVRSTIVNNGTGAVSIAKTGAAELTLTGTNTYSGGTTLNGGVLRVGNSDSALGSGGFTFGRSSTLATASGGGARNLANNVVISSGATASVDGGYAALTLSGVVSGGGSFNTASSGSVVLSGVANTYTGSTTIAGNNTLTINSIKNVGDVTGSSLGNVATAAIGTIGITNNGALRYTGTGSTTDRVINLTSGTASAISTIDQSGTGILRFNSAPTATGASIKTLVLQGSTAGTGEIAGVIPNNSATNTTALTKNGTGTWSLFAANTYTGGTTVNAGILDLAGTGGATGRIRGTATVNAGGMLRLTAGDATGYNTDATRLSVINLTGGNMHINTTSNQTLGSAVINMTSGSMTGIASSNLDFFAGASALNTLASATSSTISGVKINLRQNNGVTLTVADGAAADDLVIDSVISNSGGFTNNVLTKAGTGILRLNAANTYSTGTIVNAGTLSVRNTTGSGTGSGTVTVNSTATIGGTGSFTGALTVNTGATVAPGASAGTLATGAAIIDGTYACEIDGANADKLAVTGNLDIDGAALNVSVLGGGATQAEYVIATYTGTRTGVFNGFPEGATVITGYTITYATAGQIKLVVAGPNYNSWAASFAPNPGAAGVDYENDGALNGTEFILGGSPVSGSNNPKIYTFAADSEDVGTDKELIMTIAVPVGTPAFTAGAPATSSFAGFGIAVGGSTTLSSFPVGVTPVAPVTTGLPALTPQGGVSYEYRSFSLDGSNALAGTGFLRVTVTNP